MLICVQNLLFCVFTVLPSTSLSQKSAQKKDARRRPHECFLFTKNCFIVFAEFLDSLICQRMMCHLLDHFVRNRCDISTCECTLCHMHRVADTCCDDLCLDIMKCEALGNSFDEVDTRLGDIIKTAYERRYISCTCSCCEKCLVCRKDQGNIYFDAFRCKDLCCF